jgi:hypothetical protein
VSTVLVPWPNSVFDTSERIQNAFAGAGEAGAVIETGKADSALDGAGWVFAREAFAAGVIVTLFENAIEQLVHDQRLAHYLFGCGCVAGVEKILSPQFNRIDADGCCDFIHVALKRKDCLRRAKAAKCAVGN